jgi:hypothetical protein
MKSLLDEDTYWLISHDMNPICQKLADRHYSRKHPGSRKGFVGPGEKLVLLSSDGRALFVWLRSDPKLRADHIDGINCTIFRNESSILSSRLILEAEKFAKERWPNLKLFTYVSKSKVKSKNPGWCFMKAGWKISGENKSGKLVLLEKGIYQ